ncbi:winged helix-turn-helix transcriptional regulator [Methanocaldococcus sp. 16A]
MELELELRRKIYNLIKKHPGIHFRELERKLNIATGNLQYHLQYLEKKNLIKSENDGGYVRYFPKDCQLDENEKKIMSFLRRRTSRYIILYLLSRESTNNKNIAKDLNLSPSTVSWHLNNLINAGIVEKEKIGRESFFKIKNPEKIVNILITYRESFLDKIIDRFIETWDPIRLK